jgi:hypothetical protein
MSLSLTMLMTEVTVDLPNPGMKLKYFRSVRWPTYEHDQYCFRLLKYVGETILGETVYTTRKQVKDWLVTGHPPLIAQTQLECGRVLRHMEEKEIKTDDAFRDMRSAVLKRAENCGVTDEDIQKWVSSGNMPETMERIMRKNWNGVEASFEICFRELRQEMLRINKMT